MPLTATFTADFSQFEAAIRTANVTINTFEQGIKRAAADLNKFATSFSGANIQKEALTVATAIESIGGATKLTSGEQQRALRTLDEAIAKYAALGQTAPAEVQKVTNELRELRDVTERAEKQQRELNETAKKGDFEGIGTSVGKMAAGFLTAEAVMGALTKSWQLLTDFISKSINAFAGAEAGARKLTAALAAQGTTTPALIDQYSDLATSFEQTTGFADDLVTEAESLLITLGDVMPSEMEKALEASANLAAALGKDLPTAATLVAKAMEGNVGALAKVGVRLDEATIKAQGTAAIFDALNDRFGGQAVARMETYAGRVDALKNAWDNFLEAVGAWIVRQPIITGLLREITKELEATNKETLKVPPLVQKAHDSWLAWAVGIGPIAKALIDLNDRMIILNNQARVMAGAPKIGDLFRLPTDFEAGVAARMRATFNETMVLWDVSGERAKAAADAAATAAKQHADAIRKIRDELSGLKDTSALDNLNEAWAQVDDKTREAMDRYIEKLKEAKQEMGDEFPAAMDAFIQANQAVVPAIRTFDSAVLMVNASLIDVSHVLSNVVPTWILLDTHVRRIEAPLIKVNDAIDLFGGAVRKVTPDMDAFMKEFLKVPSATEAIGGLSQAFGQLAQAAGTGRLGEVADAIANVTSAIDVGLKGAQTFGKGLEQALKGGAKNIAAGFAGLASGIVSGFSGLLSATDTESQLQNVIGGGISGAAIGAGIGSAIAAATSVGAAAGPWGAAAGAIVGIFIGVFRGAATRRLMKQVGEEWGVDISKGTAEKIQQDAEKIFEGSLDAAKLFNFSAILKEAGGLSETNVAKLTARLRDVFVQVEVGAFTTAQAAQVLNENFAAFGQQVVESGHLASAEFLELIELNQRFGVEAKAVLDFLAAGTGRVGTGVAALAGPVTKRVAEWEQAVKDVNKAIKEGVESGKDQAFMEAQYARLNQLAQEHGFLVANAGAEIENLGIIALGAFNAAIRGGVDYVTALNQIGPGLDQLIAAQQTLGIVTEGTALAELLHFRERVTANETLVKAAAALNETMLALSHIGALNADTFAALERQGLDTFNRLIDAGFTENEALHQMKGFLETVLEAHENLGVPIDENTQRLIDQALKLGIIETKGASTNDVLIKGFDKITVLLEEIARVLGADIPRAADQAADGVNSALGRIQPPTIHIPIVYDIPDLPETPAPTSAGVIPAPTAATQNTIVEVNLDGRTIAEVVAPQIPGVVEAFGV